MVTACQEGWGEWMENGGNCGQNGGMMLASPTRQQHSPLFPTAPPPLFPQFVWAYIWVRCWAHYRPPGLGTSEQAALWQSTEKALFLWIAETR